MKPSSLHTVGSSGEPGVWEYFHQTYNAGPAVLLESLKSQQPLRKEQSAWHCAKRASPC